MGILGAGAIMVVLAMTIGGIYKSLPEHKKEQLKGKLNEIE
jgi:hypothetical protein